MVQYIGMDAHVSTSTFCVADEEGREVDNTTLETNGRLIINYLRSIRGRKKLTFEECELSKTLNGRINSIANSGDFSRVAVAAISFFLADFLTAVFHDGSKRERFRGLMSGYQHMVNETVRLKNRYKSLFRRSGINLEGERVYKDRDLLKEIERPDFRFIGIQLHYLLEKMDESLTLYQQQIIRSRKHFKEIGNLASIPGIGDIQAAKIVAQVINPRRFPNKYKYFSYCGLVRHKKESGQGRYGNEKIWGNRTLKCVYKMAGHQALKGRSALRKYYDHLRSKGVSENKVYNAVCRKIAAISLSVWPKRMEE